MVKTMPVNIPYNIDLYPHQQEIYDTLWDFDDQTGLMYMKFDRVILNWSRRIGKDVFTLAGIVVPAAILYPGLYYYVFPEYAQARKVMWDNVTNDGKKMTDYIPAGAIKKIDEQQMKIVLKNNSIIQFVGVDKNMDSLRGTNPRGVVLSEFADQNPSAYESIFRPILNRNKGWAVFVSTPKGRNHFFDVYNVGIKNPKNWLVSVKKANEVYDQDGNRLYTDEQLQRELDEGMDQDLWEQEYFCSFDASLKGAYYSEVLKKAREDGRITHVPHEPSLPVFTWWDIGHSDATAIGFFQFYGKEVRIIDYYEKTEGGLEDFVEALRDKEKRLRYQYETHYLPHDIQVTELGTKMTRLETLKGLGIRNVKVVPKLPISEGIDAAKRVFKYCWFDEKKTLELTNALGAYIKEWDDKNKVFNKNPKHNWASHPADMFRYFAISHYRVLKSQDQSDESWFTVENNW